MIGLLWFACLVVTWFIAAWIAERRIHAADRRHRRGDG